MATSVAFFCVLMLPYVINGQGKPQVKPIFSIPSISNFPLRNFEYDLQSNSVFVSGKNVLYKFNFVENELSSTVNLTKKTGPVQNCYTDPNQKQYCGDNENSVMVVTPDSLIMCSTLHGGRCVKRSKQNLNNTFDSSIALVSDINAPAVGALLTIQKRRNGNLTSEKILLFGKTYTKLPPAYPAYNARSSIFAVNTDLTGKSFDLGEVELKEDGIFDIFLKDLFKNSIKMDYKAVLEHDQFVFLLVNQNSDANIVKLCKSVDGYKPKRVYESIPISCVKDGTYFTQIEYGTFVSVLNSTYLVVLFSNSKTSAICVYEETEIYDAFLESRKHRYGCPKHNLPSEAIIFEVVKNPERKCINLTTLTKENEGLSGVFDAFTTPNFCNNVTNGAPEYGIIIGLLPLTGTALYTSNDGVTVVGSSIINDLVTLYVGTQDGNVIKIYLDPFKGTASELERIRVDRSNIKAIRNIKNETYIMSQNKIVKLLGKNCGDFSGNCSACVMAKDANCGWCIQTKSCGLKEDCPNKMNYWLPSVRNQCLKLDLKIDGSYLVNLEEPVTFQRKVYFNPPLRDFTNMKCKLGNSIIRIETGSDYVTCITGRLEEKERDREKYNVGNVTLSILLNDDVIAQTVLLLYRCSLEMSCGDCVSGGMKACYWCRADGKCATAIGDCSNSSESGISRNQTGRCPQIQSSTVRIPNSHVQNVTFSGENLKDEYSYSCKIGMKEYPGEFNGNVVKCINVQISYQEESSMSTLQIVNFRYGINQKPNLFLDKLKGETYLQAYKCEYLSQDKKDCSSCNFQRTQDYECSYCGESTGCSHTCSSSTSPQCPSPEIKTFTPMTGPTGGGTKISISGINLGVEAMNINVTVAGVLCTDISLKNRMIECTTGKSSTNSGPVIVTVGEKASAPSAIHFEYKEPALKTISPNRSIKSGGRTIAIGGDFLDVGNRIYEVKLIPINPGSGNTNPKKCINPMEENGFIKCKPNGSTRTGDHKIQVTFDGKTLKTLDNAKFTYLDDPTITGTEPSELKTIESGGTEFIVKGTGFADVLEDLHVELSQDPASKSPCSRVQETTAEGRIQQSTTQVLCKFPSVPTTSTQRRRKRQVLDTDTRQYEVEIHLDGFHKVLPGRTLYVSNPLLRGNNTISFDPEEQQDITIKGDNLAIVTRKEDYFILVGSGECALTRLNNSELVCRPPSKEPSPRAQENKLYIRVRVGNFNQIAGVVEYASELPIAYIAIGVLGVLLVVFFIGAFLIHRKMRTRNQMKIEQIMTEMHDIEQNTMRMNQEEFAEMQLNITDIKRDLVSTGIPYHSYQNYTQYVLFPKEVEAGSLAGLLQHSGFSSKNVEKAMDQFEKLMSNKYFVKSLIGTLERQRKITLIDKAQFSANFSVVMMGKMRDFFEIVNCLLSTLVDASNKKQHKTLFNRFESITLRLLSHWLSVSLYPYLKEGGGSSLFMLYKSTQAVVEKRPVDEVTGEAKNTLSEDNFLREKIDFQTLKLEIDLNGNGNLYTCEVLDCDTVNQVKSKCLYQIYKNRPASDMPTIDEVDLEWMAGKSGRLALNNIDQTSERGDGMVRCNTLQHYHVLDGSRMALLYKFSPDDEQEEDTYVNQRSPSDVDIAIPPNVQLIQSVSSTGSLENLRRWHLVKNMEEEDSHEKNLKLKDKVKTSHITNLMHTKLVLQDNIKEVFDSVLNHENIPLVVHYLFGVLENLANKNGVEPETLLCWKSESYAMRVWATLLVRPEFLFDIQKVKHVEPCLDVIKQVFIDCFHSTKISKDSSLQKLLFAQEVPHYQKRTEQFYKALANKAAVTDADFWNEMSRLNTLQQEHLKFSKPAALQKLYKFVQQYIEEIIEDLDEGPETSGLQFGKKLDDIFRQMETDS